MGESVTSEIKSEDFLGLTIPPGCGMSASDTNLKLVA